MKKREKCFYAVLILYVVLLLSPICCISYGVELLGAHRYTVLFVITMAVVSVCFAIWVFYFVFVLVPREEAGYEKNIRTALALGYIDESTGKLVFKNELDWTLINYFVGVKWKNFLITRFDEYILRDLCLEFYSEKYGLNGYAISEEMLKKISGDSKLQKTFRLLWEQRVAISPKIWYRFNPQAKKADIGWIENKKPTYAPEEDDIRIPIRVVYELK